MMSKMEKKYNEMIKKLENEIEMLTNDFDEEKKQNAAQFASVKVELDRLKRRQSRFSVDDSQ